MPWLARFQEGFEHGFERMRGGYRELLSLAIDGGARFAGIFLLAMAAAALLAFPLGPSARAWDRISSRPSMPGS